MKIFGVIILVIICIAILSVLSMTLHWCGRAADVAVQEMDPAVLLARYMWFKDSSAQLDKKMADIKVYDTKLKGMSTMYGADAKTWPRDVRNDHSIWSQEVAGIKASYNTLAGEYNSAMSKINWRFTNRGMLPQGATEVLPREYKPYIGE